MVLAQRLSWNYSQNISPGCSHLQCGWGWGSYFRAGSLTWLLAGSLRFSDTNLPFPHPLPPEHTRRGYLSLLTAWRVVSHRANIPREQSSNCSVFQSPVPKVTRLHSHRISQVSQVSAVLSEETTQGGKAHWQPSWPLVTTGARFSFSHCCGLSSVIGK